MVRPLMNRILVFAMALAGGNAVADPAPPPAKPVLPKIPLLPPLETALAPKLGDATTLLPEGWLDFTKGLTPGTTTVHPSMGGGTSLGIVVEPPPHPDARPWPRGMVVRPPDVKDRNVIEPGKKGLGGGNPTMGRRLLDGIDDSVDAIWSLVLPPGT